jgi:hypothetical protein
MGELVSKWGKLGGGGSESDSPDMLGLGFSISGTSDGGSL